MSDKKTITINQPITSDHIARIEGKAGIEVKVTDNQVEEIKINIFEGPRFFERITVNKPVEESVAVLPRICSFCSAAHKVTALQAAEDAIGLEVTNQTKRLRELLYLGDQIESHALHLFLLAIPDFLGYPDVFSMAKNPKFKDAVSTALELKDIGAKIQTVIGSRYIHQENALIGGFGQLPTPNQLQGLQSELKSLTQKTELASEILTQFENWPEVTTERNHLAVRPDNGFNQRYNFLGNTIVASDGFEFSERDYQKHIKERVVSHSFAKHGFYKDEPFMTGALSRFTLFGDSMTGRGKDIADNHPKHLDPNNPMSNNFAQAVELVYFIENGIQLIDGVLTDYNSQVRRIKPTYGKAGSGFSSSEAPRGILSYNIAVDENGTVTNTDIITPTAYFMPIMEADVGRMARGALAKGITDPEEIAHQLEVIVRSYDPCVSCSVHVTKLK